MQRLFRTIFSRFLIISNVIVAIFFLASCFAPYIDPRRWWFTGFLCLIFPYLLALIIFFVVFWLFVRLRRSLINLAILLIGLPAILVLFPLNVTKKFKVEKKDTDLRVMSWNVRRFTPFRNVVFNPAETSNKKAIIDEIRKYDPDILCLQEFFTATESQPNNLRLFQQELGYPWFVFARDNALQKTGFSGTAIFSKFPIIDSAVLKYPEGTTRYTESVIAADISWRGDTLRIYTMHLQSFGFSPRDYTNFGKIKAQQDTGLHASKNLFRKMKQTFYMHSLQADYVETEMAKSPHPVIACADLNDVPNSYAYHSVRADMTDCFLQQGRGFGKTFHSPTSRILSILPTLRIDYIFADPVFETGQFLQTEKKLSDHSALIADLKKTVN